MADTIANYTGNGTQTDFVVPFDYLKKSFVHVYVDKVPLVGGDQGDEDAEYFFVDNTTIRIKVAPAKGTDVTLRRITPADDRIVSFEDGSILKANDLDTSQLQTFHVAEEARDQSAILVEEKLDTFNDLAQDAADSAQEAADSAQEAQESAETCVDIRQEIERYSWDIPHLVDTLKDVEDYEFDGYFAVGGFGDAGKEGEDISSRYVKTNGSTKRRTLVERFADVVNVRDFGAKGDGVTDDTAAIQAALRASYEKGRGVVCIPSGTYLLSDTLYLGGDLDVRMDAQCVLKRNAPYGVMFANCLGETFQEFYYRQSSGYNGHANISVVGGTIDGNVRTFGVGNHLNGFTFYDTHDVVVEGVTFRDWGHNHQIQFGAAKNCKVLRCVFKGQAWETSYSAMPECIQLDRRTLSADSAFYPIDGVEVAGCYFVPDTSDVSGEVGGPPPLAMGSHAPNPAKNISFHDNVIVGAKIGIEFFSYDGVSIYGNRIVDAEKGIYFGAWVWDSVDTASSDIGLGCKNVQIFGNYINASAAGIGMAGRNTSASQESIQEYYNENVSIQNNVICGACSTVGIETFATKNAIVSGNLISTTKGVLNIRDCKKAVISNNRIENNNYLYQIIVSAALDYTDEKYYCEDVSFIGNTFKNTFVSDASVYSIWVERAKRTNILGNTFDLPPSSQFAVRSDVNAQETFVSGNINSGSASSKVVQSLSAQTNSIGPNYGFDPYSYNFKLLDCGPLSISQEAGLSSLHFNRVGYNNVTVQCDGKNSSGLALRGVGSDGEFFEKGFWFNLQAGGLMPYESGTQPLGYSDRLWSQVYAATGTINTSDERAKTSVVAPDEALMRAWGKVNFRVFQFKDAVEKKGSEARLHVGVIAQQVIEAFASEGLDATRYGLLCYDKWGDEYENVEVVDQAEVLGANGEVVTPAVTHTERRKVLKAGDRYGIRYEEALALEAAYQRWELEKIKKRLSWTGVNK